MTAVQALAELEKLGSVQDPVFYRPWQEGDEPVESQVDEVVYDAELEQQDARKVRLDYWGFDRQGRFRLIENGTLSGMLSERKRWKWMRDAAHVPTAKRTCCPHCHRAY